MSKNSGARTAGDGDVPVILDVQHDFCPSGPLAVPDGEAVIPVINRLATQISHVVPTQDWHPPGHTSLASSQPGKQPFGTIEAVYGQQVRWPDRTSGLCLPWN